MRYFLTCSLNSWSIFKFLGQCFLSFSTQSHAESSRNPTSPLGWGGLGLRLFQSSNWEGLPFPLPPSLGCGSRVSRSLSCTLFGARFEPPFFHDLGAPKIVITSYFVAKTVPIWSRSGVQNKLPLRNCFFLYFFSVFSYFPYHLKCLPYSACYIQTTFSPL